MSFRFLVHHMMERDTGIRGIVRRLPEHVIDQSKSSDYRQLSQQRILLR